MCIRSLYGTLTGRQLDDNRMCPSFVGVPHDPIHSFDEDKFKEWIAKIGRHTNNIIMLDPILDDADLTES